MKMTLSNIGSGCITKTSGIRLELFDSEAE
jgi:hypothetical protein